MSVVVCTYYVPVCSTDACPRLRLTAIRLGLEPSFKPLRLRVVYAWRDQWVLHAGSPEALQTARHLFAIVCGVASKRDVCGPFACENAHNSRPNLPGRTTERCLLPFPERTKTLTLLSWCFVISPVCKAAISARRSPENMAKLHTDRSSKDVKVRNIRSQTVEKTQ